jgi:hypothetical protein
VPAGAMLSVSIGERRVADRPLGGNVVTLIQMPGGGSLTGPTVKSDDGHRRATARVGRLIHCCLPGVERLAYDAGLRLLGVADLTGGVDVLAERPRSAAVGGKSFPFGTTFGGLPVCCPTSPRVLTVPQGRRGSKRLAIMGLPPIAS